MLCCEQQRRVASFIIQQALTMSDAKEAPRILLFGDVLGRLDALVKRINTVHITNLGFSVIGWGILVASFISQIATLQNMCRKPKLTSYQSCFIFNLVVKLKVE